MWLRTLLVAALCGQLVACSKRAAASDTEEEAVILATLQFIYSDVYAQGVRVRDIALFVPPETRFKFRPRPGPIRVYPGQELALAPDNSHFVVGKQRVFRVDVSVLEWKLGERAEAQGSVTFAPKNGIEYRWKLEKRRAKWTVVEKNELGQY